MDRDLSDEVDFGPFRLDLRDACLWRGTKKIEIQSRPLEVLAYLAHRPGELVSKEELLEGVWRGTYVSRTTLRVCIRNVRDALGESADAPQYIETVGRRGYRFTGATDRSADTSGPLQPQSSPRSQLVGRVEDLRRIGTHLQRACRGERQIVFVSGPAGVGKTAFLEAFLESVRATGDARTAEGQCTEQLSEAEAFGPVLDAFARLCRSDERVTAVLRRHAPCWLAQLSGALDESEMASFERRAANTTTTRMLREIAEAIEVLTVARPLVLVLEDIHWSDVSTVDLLAYLAQRPEPAKLCVVATYRPSDSIARGHPLRSLLRELLARERGQEIVLELLSEQLTETYLRTVLGDDVPVAQLAELVHERSQGNALFMVEIVDHLLRRRLVAREQARPSRGWMIDSTAVADIVPDSLRLLIERQLEPLEDEHRSVLECAAVAGRTFATESVSAALRRDREAIEDICEELAATCLFLEEVGVEEWPDGEISGRYRFLHSLHQNVLYDRIAESRRIRLHRALGERLEKGHGERTAEIAGALARHFEVGRDYRRAVRYLHASGVAALGRDAHREAYASFEQALQCLLKQPPSQQRDESELELRFRHGGSMSMSRGFADPEVANTFARYGELCDQLDNSSLKSLALLSLRGYHFVRGDMEESERCADKFHQFAADSGDDLLLSWSQFIQGENDFHRGRFNDARLAFEATLRHGDSSLYLPTGILRGTQDPSVSARINLALALWVLGDPEAALEQQSLALRLAADGGDPATLVFVHTLAAQHHYLRDEPSECAGQAEATLAVGGEHSFSYWFAYASTYRAWASLRLGENDAEEQIADALARYDATGAGIVQQLTLSFRAEGHRLHGQTEPGLEYIDRALAVSGQNGTPWADPILHRLRGELYASAGQSDEAKTSFAESLRIARTQCARSLELRSALSLHRTFPDDQTRDLLRSVLGHFAATADSPVLSAARDQLG